MASLGRQVKTTAARAATSATDPAAVAPGSRAAAARAGGLASCTSNSTPALARLVAIGIPIVPSPMNPTCSGMIAPRGQRAVRGAGGSGAAADRARRPARCAMGCRPAPTRAPRDSGGDGCGGAHRMAGATQQQGRSLTGASQERRELLHRDPAEPRSEGAASDTAKQQIPLGLERARIEWLADITQEAQLGVLEDALLDAQAQALNHERGVGRLEPVPLALAQDETPAIVRAGHRPHEEAQHAGVDDLGAVVEDAAVVVDPVAVLARALRHHATGTEGWRSTRRRSSACASAARPARR